MNINELISIRITCSINKVLDIGEGSVSPVRISEGLLYLYNLNPSPSMNIQEVW